MTRRAQRWRIHPLVISLAMILVVVAITYYAFNQGLPFVQRFTVSATVNNSVNVRSGDPVRIAGIDVGAVTGVEPAGLHTKITFYLNSNGLPVHRDATIRIRPRLFLEGSYYLQLEPGTPNAPVMQDGGAIPESHTSGPVQFFQVLSTFDVATRANLRQLTAAFARGFGTPQGTPLTRSGAAGLRSTFPLLKPTLSDVAVVSAALRGTRPGDVERLLSSASQVTGTLGASASQLASLVSGLNVTSRALVASDGALGQSISGIDETLRAAPPALAAIDRALPPLSQLAVALGPSLKQAPPLLDALSSTVGQLSAVLAPAERDKLLTSLKVTFEQFPSLSTELAQAFPITKQVSDCLRSNITPLLDQQVADGSLSTGRPVWQDFVHFLPGVAGASAGFDANGHYTRVLAAAGDNTLATTGGSGGLLGVVGSLLGQGLVGTPPPGGTPLLGARPTWFGDLTSADFRPDVPCTTQAVPSLTSSTAQIRMREIRSPAAPRLTRANFDRAASRRAGATNGARP